MEENYHILVHSRKKYRMSINYRSAFFFFEIYFSTAGILLQLTAIEENQAKMKDIIYLFELYLTKKNSNVKLVEQDNKTKHNED